mgnify:CR=1 FL=1
MIVSRSLFRVAHRRPKVKTRATIYSDFLSMVDAGKITDVQIFPNTPEIRFMDTDGMVDTARVIINDTLIQDLNNHAVNIRISPPPPEIFSTILPFLLTGGLFLFLMSRSSGGGMPQFPGMKKDVDVVENIKTRFTDVAGVDSELQEVREIVDFLKAPEGYLQAGAVIPKGCLLTGPPGTGKTLIARAIAGEAGVPFIACSASQFIELFVGLGASRIRNLFETARKKSPCIIFIDELDAIAKRRGSGSFSGGNDEREQTLNQLLTEMDGFEEESGVIILGATNRIDVLDPAVLRPGRFDRKIEVGLPDKDNREKILMVHSVNKRFEDGIQLGDIASLTTGFSGADLKNLLNEAAIYTARDKRTHISQFDIESAYEKITIGLPKNKVYTGEVKKLVAYHEAGHAVIGKLAGERVGKVTILPRGKAGGFTQFIPTEDIGMVTREYINNQIKIALGGRAAEEILYGDVNKVTTGASGDFQMATNLVYQSIEKYGFTNVGKIVPNEKTSEASRAHIDQEAYRIINRAYDDVIDELRTNWLMVEELANLLMENDTISNY